MVLTILGLGGDQGGDGVGDMSAAGDADVAMESGDADSLSDLADSAFWQYFTVRNLVAFFTGFSWAGLATLSYGWGAVAAIIVGIIVGLALVAVVMYLMRSMMRLESQGNLSLSNAVGQEATVSIMVPGERRGKGKVVLTMQNRVVELEAETEGEELRRNDRVYVLNQIDGQTVLVGKLP